jgi:hypothetical protein
MHAMTSYALYYAVLYAMLYALCYAELCYAMPFAFANTKIYRMKFIQWGKKFARMEELVVEFEIKTEEKPEFQTFLTKVQGKFESMAGFKKSFQKFQMSVDNCLKKVTQPHTHTHYELLLIDSIHMNCCSLTTSTANHEGTLILGCSNT